MNFVTFAAKAIAVLSRGRDWTRYGWKAWHRGRQAAMQRQGDIAIRDSAAFALSCYWAHYHEGWSLMLFRDASSAIRHVACETPDCTIVDVLGHCTDEQITQRLGVPVTASHGEEADVLPLLSSHSAVLEAADELRQSVEHNAVQRGTATPAP